MSAQVKTQGLKFKGHVWRLTSSLICLVSEELRCTAQNPRWNQGCRRILNKQVTWSDHDQMKDILIKPIKQTGIVSWRGGKNGKVSSWWTQKWLKGMEDRTVTPEYCRFWLDSTVGELIIYWLWGTIKWEVGENTKVLNLVTWRTQLLIDTKMLKGVGGFNGKMISLWTCWISDAWGRPSEVT